MAHHDRSTSPSAGSDAIRQPEAPSWVTARLVSLGLAVAVGAMLVQTAAHLANWFILDERYAALDATRDDNAFTWLSSVATFAAAFSAALAAMLFPRRRGRLALLAALLAFLSLDDVVQAHERLEHLTDTPGGALADAGELVFLALYFPLLAVAVMLLAGAARDAPGRAGLSISAGLALLAASIAIRLVGAGATLTGGGVPDWARVIAQAMMQDAKLGGWILVAAGLTASLCYLLASSDPAGTGRRLPREP